MGLIPPQKKLSFCRILSDVGVSFAGCEGILYHLFQHPGTLTETNIAHENGWLEY